MIYDALLTVPWLMPATLALLIVFGPFVGSLLADRRKLDVVFAIASLIPIAALTLVPVQRELYGVCEIGVLLPTIGRVEVFANLVLFVPLALFAGVALRKPLLAFFAASALSAVIEVVQAALPVIGRSCDTGDWLANTIGAAIGALLAAAALWLHRRRAARVARATAGRDRR